MNFGEKLKKIAKDDFGGVSKLAQLLGIADTSLSRYLSGTVSPGLDFLRKLSLLGIDINWLINEKNEDNLDKREYFKMKELENENRELKKTLKKISEIASSELIKIESKL